MRNNNKKPLTLEALVSYNQEILFPWLKENLVTKKEFEDFKEENKKIQDGFSKKLDILLTEKTVSSKQEKREKKMWAIIIKALQEHRILSNKQLEEIAQLENSNVFFKNAFSVAPFCFKEEPLTFL